MKKLLILLCITLATQYDLLAQIEFELEPSQSMSITGKGPGQDAAENPFSGSNCYAIIENAGKNEFTIRIQEEGEIIETISIEKGVIKKVKLLKGYELYLDSKLKGKAKIEFQKMKE
ncbi:hypothetical protein [Aquimarina sp. MMG016]|uniref:hypothetical protein n=1 Tax=Aquimarina sp. MMG016 TaxID=2822690 RepID=UPI001B3A0D97|nr:hypothetical protein [Aquimarina sp. MMG016]MBQ4819072.1 hypothetical protein [Aquimarina sp. MMG016]